MGFEPGRDELLAAKDSTLADERQTFALLWLYPDVSSLTTVLLKRLEETWDYGCAFLLEEILKLQIIYRDYLGDVDSTGSALGDGALLKPDDVRRVTRDKIDLVQELGAFLEESPDRSTRSTQPFHGLYRLSLGAVSLARYSLILEEHDVWKMVAEKSKQIAVHVVLKIESLYRSEYARLQHVLKFQRASTTFRVGEGVTCFNPTPGESHTAFDLLQIASYLATEFGALKCFRIIRKQCSDLIEQSAGFQDFQPLRLKAVSDPSNTSLFSECPNRKNVPTDSRSTFDQTGIVWADKFVEGWVFGTAKLNVSQALFVARGQKDARSMKFAIDEMQRQQLEIPITPKPYRISANTGNLRFSAMTQSEQQAAKPLDPGQ
ncbi:MAG: hypothetical protein Q9225_001290 [Loekoesia sp. 1 TL-2023]